MKLIRLLCLALCLCLLPLSMAGAAGAEIPAALRFTQTQTRTPLDGNQEIIITLPKTALPAVDEEIAGLVEGLRAEGRKHLTVKGTSRMPARLDVGANIFRTGTRWMSFLVLGRVAAEAQQLWTAADCRVYNMETGERIALTDVVSEEGFAFLQAECRRQLAAFYPEQADEALLDALTAAEALKETPFILTPGHISLYWPAAELYPQRKAALVHVDIYYPDLWDAMTETARTETDCSRYTLVAMTYDDGPMRGNSDRLMNWLRLYGAQATFFLIGDRLEQGSYLVHREYEANHLVASHNWAHVYDGITAEKAIKWKNRYDETLLDMIGVKPTMMRAPGGNDYHFLDAGIGLPVIHWNRLTQDATAPEETLKDYYKMAMRTYSVEDGTIILMHDSCAYVDRYAEIYLPEMEERNMLLVTVADMAAVRRVTLPTDRSVNRITEDGVE